MAIAGISFTKPAIRIPSRVKSTRPRIGLLARLGDWLVRPFTIDLFDMDLQMESADLEYELRYGRR